MLRAALYPLMCSNTRAASKAVHALADTGTEKNFWEHCQLQADAVKLPLMHPLTVGIALNWVVYLPSSSGT